MLRKVFALSLAVGSTASIGWAANVTFQVNYGDAAGEGFFDPALGASRRSAFEYAANVWGGYLTANYAGETVTINAKFDPLGGTATSATLGQAAAANFYRDFGGSDPKYQSSTWYVTSLANHLNGSKLGAGQEINATFNSDVDGSVLGSTNWYYGTDMNVGGNIDFATVVLHEIGHGLGFTSTIISTTGAFNGGFPTAYDRNLYGAVAGKKIDQMTDAERLAAITSGQLFWDGADGKAGNGGVRPELYAPSPYEPGSSVSHLDEAGAFAAELMSPMYSGPDHSPSQMELGMFSDMGWTVVPEPGLLTLLGGASLLLVRKRQKKAA